MKKQLKLIAVFTFVLVATIVLAGCEPKREEVEFKGEEGAITFATKEDSGCKISTNKDDFTSSREQGVLLCSNFKIGIEFSNDLGYFFDGNFKKLQDARKAEEDFKKVTYGTSNGFQYYYGGYTRYNVLLPVRGSKKYFLALYVYGDKNNEKSAKEAIKSEEVQDVLNNIKTYKSIEK